MIKETLLIDLEENDSLLMPDTIQNFATLFGQDKEGKFFSERWKHKFNDSNGKHTTNTFLTSSIFLFIAHIAYLHSIIMSD